MVQRGLPQTHQNLEANGIQYFGHYDYSNSVDVCEVISLPVSVKNDDGSSEKGQLPVALVVIMVFLEYQHQKPLSRLKGIAHICQLLLCHTWGLNINHQQMK